MKKFFISAAASLIALAAGAVESAPHSLVITKKSGETVEYKFADQPVATFEGADMVITLALTGTQVTYPAAQVATLTVTPRTLGVDDAAVAVPTVTFEIAPEAITCSGLAAGTRVALYAADGRIVASAAANADGSAVIALGGTPAGVYIVAAGNESFKFIK